MITFPKFELLLVLSPLSLITQRKIYQNLITQKEIIYFLPLSVHYFQNSLSGEQKNVGRKLKLFLNSVNPALLIIQTCSFTYNKIICMLRYILGHRAPIFLFSSSTPSYRKYLSDHVIKVLEAKPQSYNKCSEKFNVVIQKFNQLESRDEKGNHEISSKLNMIFRIFSLPEVLSKYKDELSEMVTQSSIKNQSDLDRICQILTKKVKTNKSFQLKDIVDMKKEVDQQRQKFDQMIKQLKENDQDISIPELSKALRQKFITIESKQIYDKLKQLSQLKKKDKKPIERQTKEKESTNRQFWDKLQNIKPRLLPEQCNDPETYRKHLEITQGKLRFRFPPQPNGYLHIGHIKSIRINFETAKRNGGICFLRYDDTNPETESHEYIENILKNVRWLGYEPDHITYASDFFQQMIDFAIQLIKEGHAYVCDSSQIQMERERKEKMENKYRKRTVEESLAMFPNLKEGQTLRLKLDPFSKNPTLRDPVIYRIKEEAHPRTGTKYRIYPIYDFAHCICDSLEHIDYSLCSLEFQVRRELYYKILDLLKLYKPIVWEYSRLNVEGSVISKRKIKALIESQAIASWSDPRLLTIGGLMNRGYTPSMLINFIDKVNASRAGNENVVQFSLLEREMRKELFKTAEKSMMVLNPLPIEVQGMEEGQVIEVQAEIYTSPQRKEKRKVTLSKKVFVQLEDQVKEKGKIIVLKYLGAFQVLGSQDRPEETIGIIRRLEKDIRQLKEQKKDYKVIHWISEKDGTRHPVILFDRLLDPENKVSFSSKIVHNNALIPVQMLSHKGNPQKYWQMERLGYFKFDNEGQLIRCTSLQ